MAVTEARRSASAGEPAMPAPSTAGVAGHAVVDERLHPPRR